MRRELTAAMEDYLEAILSLKREKKVVRVKDIARALGVRLPTVTSMLQSLRERGLVEHEKYEHVDLSPKGEELAEEISRRHRILKGFLEEVLGVDGEKAEEDACRIEHAISPETLERLVRFTEFVFLCPRSGREWLEQFQRFYKEGIPHEECATHIRAFIEDLEERVSALGAGEGVMKVMRLKDLEPGKKGRITAVKGKRGLRRRLLDMGVVPGALVEMERVAPLGDPVEVRVKGYHLSLRKEEAEEVYVEEI